LVTSPVFKPNLLHFAINVGKLFTGEVPGSAFRVERKGLSAEDWGLRKKIFPPSGHFTRLALPQSLPQQRWACPE